MKKQLIYLIGALILVISGFVIGKYDYTGVGAFILATLSVAEYWGKK